MSICNSILLLFGQTSFNLAFCCYLHHQFFNWASVPGGRFSNSPTSQSPNVACKCRTDPTSMTKKIILIACVSQKGDKKAKAKDLYISQLFKSSLAFANKQNPDKIFILSALHHLLDIDQEIEPYNVTLSSVPKAKRKPGLKILTSEEKVNWGKKVVEQLSKQTDLQNDEFMVLAGQEYIKPIINSIPHFQNPLNGLRQGERVKFLNEN